MLSLAACDNDDLSRIDDYYQDQRVAEYPLLKFSGEFTPDQVVSDTTVTTTAQAQVALTIDSFDGSIRGAVHSPTIEPESIGLYEGQAGLTGIRVLTFEWDPEYPDTWRVPPDKELSLSQLDRSINAELYVQITSRSYPQGELRAQLVPVDDDGDSIYYDVLTVELSGETFDSYSPLDAKGKAFMTIEYGDDISIRGIVRISNMTRPTVALLRVNNPNNRMMIHLLEPEGDYWQLPAGATLNNDESNALFGGRLYFIAISDDPMAGEIAGMLCLTDECDSAD